MSRAPTAPEAANHRARRPRSPASGRDRGSEPPGGRDGTGRTARGGTGRGGSGSRRGRGVWRRRPWRAAPPGGLVFRAPGAVTHIRGSCRLPPATYMWPLRSPGARCSPPGEEDLGLPPGLSPPKPRLCRDELMHTAPQLQPSPAPCLGHTPHRSAPDSGVPVTPSRRLSCGGAPAR